MNGPFRGGMQVHAVPDEERAYDAATGVKLPWGYSYADASLNKSAPRQPLERGPFGKPTVRRSVSRTSRASRTVTPSGPPQDPDKLDMQKQQDNVFGELRSTADRSTSRKTPTAQAGRHASFDFVPTRAATSRDIIPGGGSPDAAIAAPQAESDAPPMFAEPTEVLLYGYLPSQQPAVLAFFETASRGLIYEDYDRAVANPRFAQSSLLSNTNTRRAAAAQATQAGRGGLTQPMLRKINEYKGGDHWIKVTFDSPIAAERAIEASPHVIGGCSVRAEMWHGHGPREDVATPAEGRATAGTLGRQPRSGRPSNSRNHNFSSLPARGTIPPGTYGLGDSTSSTETAGASSSTLNPSNDSSNTLDASTSSATLTATGADANGTGNGQLRQRPTSQAEVAVRKPKIKGARTATLQPKESALLPVVPWRTQLLASIPLLGNILVPSAAPAPAEPKGLPKREDGSVDWSQASWGWWLYRLLDKLSGADFCGLKGDD